jgi:hypothetical protein
MQDEFSIGIRFVLCCLATWRLTHLITAEDGPWDIIVRLRTWMGDSIGGRIMDCFYCASIWVAIPFCFVVGHTVPGWIVAWLAISGAASLLEQATNRELHQTKSSHLHDGRE